MITHDNSKGMKLRLFFHCFKEFLGKDFEISEQNHLKSNLLPATLAWVSGTNFDITKIFFPILMFFLVVLNDRLRCGVIDSKFLSDLSDKIDLYIDDTPSLLNASQQFCFCLLTDLFVFFSCMSVFDIDWLYVVEN